MNYHGLNITGLRQEIKHLKKLKIRNSLYTTLMDKEEGAFFHQELKDIRDYARSMYKNIDLNSDQSQMMLCMLQTYERIAEEWLTRFTNAKKFINNVDEQIKQINSVINTKKTTTGRENQLVPTSVKQKMEN